MNLQFPVPFSVLLTKSLSFLFYLLRLSLMDLLHQLHEQITCSSKFSLPVSLFFEGKENIHLCDEHFHFASDLQSL